MSDSTTVTDTSTDDGPAAGADASMLGPAGLLAWRSFLVAHSRLLAELDENLRAEHGFTIGDYDVLVQLARAPGQRHRMCDLAEAVLLSPSGLSRRVARLERDGLVERRRSEEDGRSIEAGLSAAGKRLFTKLNRTHLARVRQRFVDHYSEAELEQLGELLARIVPPGED